MRFILKPFLVMLICLATAPEAASAAWEIGVIDSSGDVGSRCELVLDGSGNMHAVYRRTDIKELMVISSIGTSWQSPERVDTSGTVGAYCGIAVTGAGVRKLAYYRSSCGTLVYAGPELPMEWETGQVTSSGDDIGRYCAALGRPDGSVSVSCRNTTQESLVIIKRDPYGVWAAPETIDPGPSRGSYCDHAYAPSRGIAFSEYDAAYQSLLYIDPILTLPEWEIGIVTDRFKSGRYVSSCLAPDGRIASAFYSYNESSLGSVLISGTNEAGGSVVKGVLDSIGDNPSSGVFIDLAVTPGWDWHISYRNALDGYLWYVFADSSVITGTEDENGEELPPVPKDFHLYQNVPNPFNPVTTIMFDLPRDAHVKLRIYNVKGELIARLIGEDMKAGRKKVTRTARNDKGGAVSSGIYFYRLEAGDFVETRKMVLLR